MATGGLLCSPMETVDGVRTTVVAPPMPRIDPRTTGAHVTSGEAAEQLLRLAEGLPELSTDDSEGEDFELPSLNQMLGTRDGPQPVLNIDVQELVINFPKEGNRNHGFPPLAILPPLPPPSGIKEVSDQEAPQGGDLKEL